MANTPAKAASGTRSRAGRQNAPKDQGAKSQGDGAAVLEIGQPARSQADIDAERAGVQPKQVTGVGTPNRLLGPVKGQDEDGAALEQDDVDLSDIADTDPSTVRVVLKHDVYEEFLAPGSTTRYIRKLRWRKGRSVSKAELDRHAAAQRKAKKAGPAEEPTAHDDPTGGTGQ